MTGSTNTPPSRLCYLGNMPVEATSAGPAQLFRLLQSLEPDKVFVIESDCLPSLPARRLPGVTYRTLSPFVTRGWYFARTRAPRLYWPALRLHVWWQAWRAARLTRDFKPSAIVTLHDGFEWMTAAALAARLKIPLHLILHDDWFRNLPMAGSLHTKFEQLFGEVYRQAASRLCISPYMEAEYGHRFRASGTVLFPIRAANAHAYDLPGLGPAAGATLKIAFAGNLWHRGNWISLQNLVAALESIGGQLLVFGPTNSQDLARHNLVRPNVTLRGFVPDLIQSLRTEAHAVFVPMTFDESEKRNMEICFPSKMTEYTAAGLPLLIQGPEYGSAIRWAQSHPGSAEVVTEQSVSALAVALEKLRAPEHRKNLGRHALELGHRYFSFEAGVRLFREAVEAIASRRHGDKGAI